MASVLAIVSKAVFEAIGVDAKPGTILAIDRYASTHKALSTLAGGGSIYLVTVRPPDEQLWLVGILDDPAQQQDGWYATNASPIQDITALASKLVFASGKGLAAKPGALAMSLQTPRVLTDADVAVLRGKAPKPARPAKPAKPAKPSAPKAEATGLSAIEAALADDDAAAALEAALAAWRTTRATALADLIDAITAKLEVTPITDDTTWSRTAHAGDAADVGALLAAIPALPVSFLPQAGEALAELPDDPRIAHAVAQWTLDPPTMSSSTHSFWTRTLEAMTRIGDPRVVPILKKRLRMKAGGGSQFWPKLYKGVEKALSKLTAIETPVDAKAIARLTKAVARLAAAPPSKPAKVETSNAPKLDGPALGQALEHLEAGRLPAAIEAMAAAWREHGRQPAIADIIDRATRLLPTWDQALGFTDKDVIAAWDAAYAGDPQATMPQLLDNVTVGGPKIAERHFIDLAALPDDPRIAMRLASLCSGSTASPERTQFWKSLLELLARIADPRVANELCIMFDEFRGDYYNHHRQARRIIGDWAKSPPVPPALGRAETTALAKLATALAKLEAKRDTTERDLVNAIVDAWDDDAPRLVYADWLTERQHARGEIIVLACKDPRTPAEDKRLHHLLKTTTNAYGLLEQLAEAWYASRGTSLDRGMPTTITVRRDTSTLVWRSLVGYPLLATIEAITCEENALLPASKDFAAILLDPTARRLAKVTGVPQDYWNRLRPHVDGKWKQKGTSLVRA